LTAARTQAIDVIADGVARAGREASVSSCPKKELLYEGARAKPFSFAALEPEIMTGHADLTNISDGLLHA
jgi:hypothetical protein